MAAGPKTPPAPAVMTNEPKLARFCAWLALSGLLKANVTAAIPAPLIESCSEVTTSGLLIVTISTLGLPRTAPPVGLLRPIATVASLGFALLVTNGRVKDCCITPGGN